MPHASGKKVAPSHPARLQDQPQRNEHNPIIGHDARGAVMDIVSGTLQRRLTLTWAWRRLVPRAVVVAEVHVKTLKRASEILGEEQPLALQLRVTPRDLRRWLAGVEPPPLDVFLLAVDVVTKPNSEQEGVRKLIAWSGVAACAIVMMRHGFGGHPYGPGESIGRERRTGRVGAAFKPDE